MKVKRSKFLLNAESAGGYVETGWRELLEYKTEASALLCWKQSV
ncbi:hypothetical protein GGR01_000183 [Acetobacter oeni]|nr:hypothetical protein [Acetobacter oeni]